MNEQTSSIFVDKFYEMDPEFEDLLSHGKHLQNGMIVLLEDSLMREETTSRNDYAAERMREVNRWCEVSQLEIIRRYDYDDQMGSVIAESAPLISFIAIYSDGTKKKRRYDSSYAWIVKLDSVPKCTNPECPQAGNCPLNEKMVRECVENF